MESITLARDPPAQSRVVTRPSYGGILLIIAGLCLYLVHRQHANMTGFIPLPRAQCPECNWAIDGYGHEDYIKRVAQSRHIPEPGACWECHQPPLYYMLAGAVYGIAAMFASVTPLKVVGLLSIVFAAGFLSFGERVLRLEITSTPIYYLCLCLLVFWPLQTVMANRIGNDPPFYLADAGAFYYVVQWRRQPTPSALSHAVLWTGIALAVKYTALITVPFVVSVVAVECYRKRALIAQLQAWRALVSIGVCLALVIPTMGRTYRYYRVDHRSSLPLLVPTAPGLVRSMAVSNDRVAYFLLPQPEQYVASPFLGQGRTHTELRYFVNYLLKTSLYGFVMWRPTVTAYILNALLCSMFACLVWSSAVIAFRDPSFISDVWPSALFAAGHIVALAAYRLWYPHIGNQDFRFVYSAVIPLVVVYGTVLSWYRVHGHINWFRGGMTLAALFVVTSVGFILSGNFG